MLVTLSHPSVIMERLFGRGKTKKASNPSPVVPVSPSNTAVTTEDEGFAIVTSTRISGTGPNIYPDVHTQYPVVNPKVPNGASPSSAQVPYGKQNSSGNSTAYLDGIPFVLSSRCSGNDLDEVIARVENIAERIRKVDWSTMIDYDFRLEKSVVSQDESDSSMHRLHIN